MPTVSIKEETYQRLKEIAAAKALGVDQLLDEVARAGWEGAEVKETGALPSGSPQWHAAFEAWIASHAHRKGVADDSRDSIYGDERQ